MHMNAYVVNSKHMQVIETVVHAQERSLVRKDTNNNRYCCSHFPYFFISLHNLLNPCL